MDFVAQVRKKKIEDNPEGVTQFTCEIVVLDDDKNVVNKRNFRADLQPPDMTQDVIQQRLDQEKERLLSETKTTHDIDLDALG